MTAQELAKAMMEMTFTKDETIFEQGAPWSMWSLPIEQTIFRMGNQWLVYRVYFVFFIIQFLDPDSRSLFHHLAAWNQEIWT